MGISRELSMSKRRQRGDVLAAARRIVTGQAGELVAQPPAGQHPEQPGHFPGPGLAGRDHQVEPFSGQRDERQAVGQRRRFAGDAASASPAATADATCRCPVARLS